MWPVTVIGRVQIWPLTDGYFPTLKLFSTHRILSQLANLLRELSSNHNIWKHSLPACELAFAMSEKEA